MSIVTVAVIIVAVALGVAVFFALAARMPGWAAFIVGALVVLLVYTVGPRLLGG